jgi:hypothetical protein
MECKERFRCWILAGLVCLAVILPNAHGQGQAANGIIEGAVTDSSGAILRGVNIEVKNKDTGFTRAAVTNEAGRYTAPLLPLGNYDITAELTGFATVRVGDVLVQVGQVRVVDIVMKVSAIKETVVVSGGDVPLIETSRAHTSAIINDRAVHELPILARNFNTFALLTPGTLVTAQTGLIETGFSIGGQKGTNSSYAVDGADYTSSFYAGQTGGDRPPFTLSLEAVKEFVVMANGINAEFGRSGGGLMNVVTKSGTNEFHGSGFWFFQDKNFVHSDAFGFPPLGRRQQFGATVGGPIVKDRLFFFAASDNQKRNSPINLVFDGQSILQAAANSGDPNQRAAAQALLGKQGQITAGDDVWSLLAKVDWMINPANNLSTRYNLARNNQDNGSFGVIRQRAAAPEAFGLEKDTVDAVNVQLATIASPKLINEFRFHITREDRPRIENTVPGTVSRNDFENGASVFVAGITAFTGLGAPFFLPIGSVEDRYQFTDNVSYSFGKHDLKFGTDLNFISFDNLFRGFGRGVYTFFSFDAFAARQPNQFQQFFGSGQAVTHPKYTALFAQDSWKARPGLTVSYGLRWETQLNPTGDLPNTDFLEGTEKIPNDVHQWSPRLGIAWDPANDGMNLFRAYAAYLYAPTPTLLWANVLRQNGDVTNGVTFLTSNPTEIPPFPFPYEGPYQTPFDQYPGTISTTSGTVPGGTVNMVDPTFHNPRILRTNVSYEREIVRDLTATVTYDFAATTGNQRFHDLNLFPGTPHPVTGRIIYDRSRRPYPFAGQVISRESGASARYNALILAANKRFSSRFQMQAFYTYGRNFADDENERLATTIVGYDQYDFALDWGRSVLDVRHNFVLSGVFDAPFGIQLSPIIRAQSGRPFNAVTGTDSPTAFTLSAEALDNFRRYIGDSNATVYGGGNGDLNQSPAGTFATGDRPIVNGVLIARNAFDQPGFFLTDLRVAKNFRFAESQELQLIVDFFNLFDNANKFTTNWAVSSPSFGALNNAGSPFAVQLAVRYRW